MIWEPFVLALVLGLIISAGLYFAYLWPSIEPVDETPVDEAPAADPATPGEPTAAAADDAPASRTP